MTFFSGLQPAAMPVQTSAESLKKISSYCDIIILFGVKGQANSR